jgi:hypothetical protein
MQGRTMKVAAAVSFFVAGVFGQAASARNMEKHNTNNTHRCGHQVSWRHPELTGDARHAEIEKCHADPAAYWQARKV